MALPATPITATSAENRTARIQIEIPKGQTPIVEVFRETVHMDAQGAVLRKDAWTSFQRTYAQAAPQSVTITGGVTITGAQMYEAIAAFCDMWAQEPAPTPDP